MMCRQRVLAVAVALLLVTSGCVGIETLTADERPSPPDDDITAKFDSLETLSATQVSTLETENETNTTRATVHIDFEEPRRQYQYVHEPAERSGDVSVTNESTSIVYDASENSVTLVPRVDGASPVDRGDFFARLVAAARDDGQIENPSGGVSPLPVVPSTTTAPGAPDSIEAYDVDYLGTDTVAERTVHGFRMTAASDAAIDFDRTMWLDAEYYYPLKTNQTLTLQNETYHTTMHLEDVRFNADLPDDVFEFETPDDATVETLGADVQTFDSLTALRANTPMVVPEPDVPDGYEFHQAQLFQGNHTQSLLHYSSEDGRLTVSKSPTAWNESSVLSAGENVTVAGHEGQYIATGQSNLVAWSCDSDQYSVFGSPLGKEELLTVAESVACE